MRVHHALLLRHTHTHTLSPSQTSCLCSFCQRPRGEGNCCGSRATEHRPDCLLDRDQWAKKCGACKVQRWMPWQNHKTFPHCVYSQSSRPALGFFSNDQPRSIPCSAFAIESEWPRREGFFLLFFIFIPPHTPPCRLPLSLNGALAWCSTDLGAYSDFPTDPWETGKKTKILRPEMLWKKCFPSFRNADVPIIL